MVHSFPTRRSSDLFSARAAGQVTLSRGSRSETLSIRELAGAEAAPVLKRYLTRVPITRPYFDVKPDSPLRDFVSEAPRHPVFQLGSSGARNVRPDPA